MQGGAEAIAAQRSIEIPLEIRRLSGLDPQQHERRAVAFAQQARTGGDVRVDRNGVRALDAGTDRDLLEVDAEAGMTFLPAGLAVVAVVDAEDGEVRRVDDGDGTLDNQQHAHGIRSKG